MEKYFKVYNITTNDMKEKDHIYNYLKKINWVC